ncbi:putative Uncharacterized protein C56G2.4 [Hypsibius exemplaris]|uniref:Uncharacterized protein n=1 Tax=Hypsibius exemplaris TaxID=2072580 RepID=A0A1W0XDR0_HYPEX|nr:putative Uncharacterized protein C56G2.4 [Hypsibius exemplaris]
MDLWLPALLVAVFDFAWRINGQFNTNGLQTTNDNNKNNCRPEFRRFGEQACLDNILRLVGSDTAFWFGKNLESSCNSSAINDVNDPNCYLPNASGQRKYTILDRLFSVPPNINRFDRYLTVNYDSPEGNYTACGGDFQMPRRGINANPDMSPTSPWFIRRAPTFSMQVDQNTYYTIVTMDGSTGDVLGAVINYPYETQDAIGYHPLLQARNRTSPVVFVAYRQSGRTSSVSPKWTNIMAGPDSGAQFDLSSFALDQQLSGPIAMNVMPVNKDPWAAQQRIDQRGPNFCAQFISEALGKASETFIQRFDRSGMDSFLTVGFSSSASSFTVCCSEFTYVDSVETANPLSDKTLGAITIRTQPDIRITRANGGGGGGNSDRLYTIMAVDPSTPKNALSTPERPYTLWLAVNVKESQGSIAGVGTANNVLGYAPTIPAPQSPPHTIYFFLFEQSGEITDATQIGPKYSDPLCADFVLGRCLFQITNFTKDYGLKLRAASWITVVNDAYARYWMIKSGQVEWDICAGQPKYTIPCLRPGELAFAKARVTEVSAGSTLTSSIRRVVLSCFQFEVALPERDTFIPVLGILASEQIPYSLQSVYIDHTDHAHNLTTIERISLLPLTLT